MRRLRMLLASAVAAGSLVLVSPATASAQANCETLQNQYAAVVQKALVRARALGISDNDFVKLRDELQKAGADGTLTDTELMPLASKFPVLITVASNEADKALIQDLVKKYNTYVAANCDATNGDADAGTVRPSGSAATSTTRAPASSTATSTATRAPAASTTAAGGSQVGTLPNDAPETGDGSTVEEVQSSGALILATVSGLSVAALSGLAVAARRARS